MRSEVQSYQNKLRQLDEKQQELIRDNLELKELCLYLDEERSRISTLCANCGASTTLMRDDGDGSSSDEPITRYLPVRLKTFAVKKSSLGVFMHNKFPRINIFLIFLLKEPIKHKVVVCYTSYKFVWSLKY